VSRSQPDNYHCYFLLKFCQLTPSRQGHLPKKNCWELYKHTTGSKFFYQTEFPSSRPTKCQHIIAVTITTVQVTIHRTYKSVRLQVFLVCGKFTEVFKLSVTAVFKWVCCYSRTRHIVDNVRSWLLNYLLYILTLTVYISQFL